MTSQPIDLKKLAASIQQFLLPVMKLEASEAKVWEASQSPIVNTLWSIVKPLCIQELEALRAAIRMEDVDSLADLRACLRQALKNRVDLQAQIMVLITKMETEKGFTISNQKNTISGSTINAGNNVHIGDVVNHYPKEKALQKENSNKKSSVSKAKIVALKTLVGQNRIDDVLEEMEKISLTINEDIHDDCVQLLQKWNTFKQEEIRGLLGNSESNLKRNIIVDALLKILRKLQKSK